MPKAVRKRFNNKRVAHTPYDMRFTLQNKVKMNKCPFCTQHKLQVKPNSKIAIGTWVWTECSGCELSGEEEKIKVNHLTGWQDVLSTLIDANEDQLE